LSADRPSTRDPSHPSGRVTTYRDAGVDIDAKYSAVKGALGAIRSTFTPGVMSDIGLFGGLFDLKPSGFVDPVLVASTDGVGTKVKIARRTGRYRTVGQDLVNHCVNDILVQGARPLFFLDYVAMGRMEPGVVTQVIEGLCVACRENGCALIGGETAEMPGLYGPGDFDLAGTIVGAVERGEVVTGSAVRAGDAILALPSSGLHTNGYSLAQKVLFEDGGLAPDSTHPLLEGASLADALLAVHRSYLAAVRPLLGRFEITAMAHITGGGLLDNVPRVLPEGVSAEIRREAMAPPPIMKLIQEVGHVAEEECYRVLNMGFGYLIFVRPEAEAAVLADLRSRGEAVESAGRVVPGPRQVLLR
jgi:phosphoribosylformylglycinamidine cyclo-ligase